MHDRIGFIGLGEMGMPMARNLMRAGYKLRVYGGVRHPLQDLQAQGAEVVKSPREVAQAADTVIIMVRTTEQVKEVLTGADGVFAGANQGSTILVMSTIDPLVVREMAKLAAGMGVALLDCPVSGARQGAEAATLTIMVGGAKDAFEASRPIFETLGKNIFYLGESGMGEVAKLTNNLLLLVHMNAAYEAVSLATKAGAELESLLNLIKVSTGGSWVVEHWDMVTSWKENYQPGGTLDLVYKDMGIVLAFAESLRVPLHLSSLAKQLGRY
jgi:3-hydroxyisobutyrate dehydrogenase-like beta-hydroxyacid dehydrogenase